jgi:hypothetical protein
MDDQMTYRVTLDEIRANRPCKDGWEKLLKSKGKTVADDEPFPLADVLESNGLDDALWCPRALDRCHDNAVRLLVCDLVEPAMAFVPAGETRPQEALRVARAFAGGRATADELDAARAAARAAEAAAWNAAEAAARDAAGDAQTATFRAWLEKGVGQ